MENDMGVANSSNETSKREVAAYMALDLMKHGYADGRSFKVVAAEVLAWLKGDDARREQKERGVDE